MNLALVAAAATGVQVGAAIVASRFAVAEIPPLTLAMLRYAIGFTCLLPFAIRAWSRDGKVQQAPVHGRTADLLAMAALGIGQFGVLIALLNFGLRHVGAGQAALIFSLFPLLTLLLAAAMGRERITPRLLGGVIVSIAGVALTLWPKLGAASGHWWGEAAVAAAACTGALCSVLYRPYLQRYPTVPVSAFAMLASVAFLAAAAIGEAWPSRIATFSASAWAATAFIGVSSGIGYVWWLYALKHESPTRVTVFLALNPVTAAVLGVLLLGESLPAASLAAVALIGLGLWLATRPGNARVPASGYAARR
ncbi:DMT family transporter [Caenimonas aquaedulcis]|uniref:DMT family transporter n=1 Tax=Caenimonas aquaedulcis TaxID=2793270 RepID=A0A931H1I9_9BURK|nr:DMT family transporter [Caenimonas aquaedulcis]MBG9386842.1 DMT family transporter [Caenimonas aquaedulcis]